MLHTDLLLAGDILQSDMLHTDLLDGDILQSDWQAHLDKANAFLKDSELALEALEQRGVPPPLPETLVPQGLEAATCESVALGAPG